MRASLISISNEWVVLSITRKSLIRMMNPHDAAWSLFLLYVVVVVVIVVAMV